MTPEVVVILNDFGYINGGASSVAISEAQGLAEHGFKVIFFCAVGPVSDDLLNRNNLRVVCTDQQEILSDPNRIRAIGQGLWNSQASHELHLLLSQLDLRKTVVHLHGWTKALSSSIVQVAVDLGFKIICTVHDYFLACPNGGFYNYVSKQICPFDALSFDCLKTNCDMRNYPQKLWRFARGIIQKQFGHLPKNVIYYIMLSDLSLEIIRSYLPQQARIFKIDNPVVLPKFEQVKVSGNQALVTVGRVSPEKGQAFFARAVRETSCPILMIGDGPDREEVLRINPRVQMTGWVSRPQVIEYLKQARALIYPSLLYETQGLSVLEAAAMGVPVLVADTCAAREKVINGETGFWFRGGDAEDLRSKIDYLKDDSLVDAIGTSAYNRYWSNPLTIECHIQELVEVYESVLANH